MYQPISQRRISLLRSLLKKKKRKELNKCRAEGSKIIKECLELPHSPIQEWFATEEWLADNNEIIEQIDIVPSIISKSQHNELSAFATPQGPIFIADLPDYSPSDDLLRSDLVIVLDDIQDPGNVGTIIRIADWFAAAIILGHHCADEFSPKVIQSAMGSVFRVPMQRGILSELLPKFTESHTLVGATLDGQDLRTFKKKEKHILVIGNESRGINQALLKLLDKQVKIPQFGKAESLNAAVAAGILASHFKLSV